MKRIIIFLTIICFSTSFLAQLEASLISSDKDYTICMSDVCAGEVFFCDDEQLRNINFLNCYLNYSRTGNLISQSDFGPCYMSMLYPTDDETKAFGALNNAYSYVIADNELIIYFKKDKNHNLLILKKLTT